jgi:hypothetical protein
MTESVSPAATKKPAMNSKTTPSKETKASAIAVIIPNNPSSTKLPYTYNALIMGKKLLAKISDEGAKANCFLSF